MHSSPAVREFWDYRELFWFLAWRDLKVRYKQTKLGVLWAVLQPLLMMAVFTAVFQKAAGMPTGGMPGPLFFYAALLPWTYFANALTGAGQSLVANAPLLTKVYFPRMTLPAAAVLTGVVDFAIASALLLPMLVYYGVTPGWELLLWPLLLAVLVALALGCGLFLAALNVSYRDVKYALPFGIQILLFLSPVIYAADLAPDALRSVIALNPLTGIIEAFRASLAPDRAVDFGLLAVSVAVTAVLLPLGMLYFRRTERAFADII